MHERLRDAMLNRWGRLTVTHPGSVLMACLIFALGSLAIALSGIEFRPDRSELVSPERLWNKRYLEYKTDFERWGDLVVVLAGAQQDTRIDDLSRRLAEHLARLTTVDAADAGFDSLEAPRMYLGAEESSFESAIAEFEILKRLTDADNVNSGIAALLNAYRNRARVDEDRTTVTTDQSILDSLLSPMLAAALGEPAHFSLPESAASSWQSFRSSTGRLRLVFVQLARGGESIGGLGAELADLREEVGEFLSMNGAGDVEWGVTGIPAIEADETTQSIRDSSRASVVALVLITVLMIFVFRGLSIPLLAIGSLLVGLAWSFGWVVVSVGHLQLLSVIFSVILLGLGVDFALHLVARLELIAHEGDDLEHLMPRVFRSVGPGLITGAITTAAAFVAIAFTDFRGAAETGIIAGGGIVLCLLAVLFAFPALLQLTGRWKGIIHHREGGEDAHFLVHLLHWVYEHPRWTIIGAALVCASFAWSARDVRYDPNLLNLYPPGIESVDWEARLREEDAPSAWAGLIVVDPERAREIIARLQEVDEVASVGGAAILLPPDIEQRLARVKSLSERSFGSLPIPPGVEGMDGLLRQIELGSRSADNSTLADRIEGTLAAAAQVAEERRTAAWTALNESFEEAVGETKSYLSLALDSAPFSSTDLPRALRHRWVGRDGRWLLLVEPFVTDQSILDPIRLERFVTSVRARVPEMIGPPVQIYESSRLIRQAYRKAALLALPAILILLILDFRSVWDSLCAVLPVAIGFLGIFGVMGATDMPLNFANMIVMPIVLGVCVDAGVHVVHRWRDDPNGRPPGLSGGTGRAICLTMLTTMIGFGSMVIARHKGIQSLGVVMIIGLLTTLLACLTILPAILMLRKRPNTLRRQDVSP